MSTLYRTWESIQFYWVVIGLLALTLFVIYDSRRGLVFIRRVLLRSRLSAAWALINIYGRHPWLLTTWSERRFRAARLFAEIEILEPATDAPNPDDFIVPKEGDSFKPGSDWNAANARWEKLNRRRRDRISTLMFQQLKEEKHNFPSRLNKLLRDRLGSLVGEPLRSWLGWMPQREPRYVQIAGFHDLNDKRDDIRRYFGVLQSMGEADNAFIAKVQIEWGYLSPIFLVTGLINRFGEGDGWKRIIDNYPALLKHDYVYAKDVQELRAFLFNCWLLWGPSIPRCNCPQWHTRGDDLILQYGYGDENNSLDVIIKDKGRRAKSELKDLLRLGEHRAGALTALGAAPYFITGQLRWGPGLADAEIGRAQWLIRGGSEEMQDPLEGRIVLQADWENCRAPDENRLSPYYSAYLWVMFVILDRRTGRPFHEAQPWKNLLAYFEHSNIADATTYQALKENLVAKICSSLAKILEAEGDLAIGYACAFDDSNCSAEHGAVFVPVGSRLVDILQERIPRESSYLATAKREGRLLLPDTHRVVGPNPYSSCHLPEMIERFYTELDEAAEAARLEAERIPP
jgi:hypothetical protein